MIAVIVDTDVVSFLFKQDARADLYRPHLNGKLLGISFMTLAELHRWALERQWGSTRKARLEAYLQQLVIHWADFDLCRWWAYLQAQARQKGRPLADADAWIAATAFLYGCPLITHNRKDFTAIDGLIVISEAP